MLAKVGLGSVGNAIGMGAIKTAIDVEFQQTIFVGGAIVAFEHGFELGCEKDFFELSCVLFVAGEKNIFDNLLGEGAATACFFARA